MKKLLKQLEELLPELESHECLRDEGEIQCIMNSRRIFASNATQIITALKKAQAQESTFEHIRKFDLFPTQVKLESPRYWKGYRDTVEKILDLNKENINN